MIDYRELKFAKDNFDCDPSEFEDKPERPKHVFEKVEAFALPIPSGPIPEASEVAEPEPEAKLIEETKGPNYTIRITQSDEHEYRGTVKFTDESKKPVFLVGDSLQHLRMTLHNFAVQGG